MTRDNETLLAHLWRSNLDDDVWIANVVMVGDIASGMNAGRIRGLKRWVEETCAHHRFDGEAEWVREDENRWAYFEVIPVAASKHDGEGGMSDV